MGRRLLWRFGRVVAVSLGAFVGLMATSPATSFASQAFFNGSRILYSADPGEANHVTVTYAAGVLTITDTGAVIVAGTSCASVSPTQVTCTWPVSFPPMPQSASVDTGDLNDVVLVASSPVLGGFSASGGAGDDMLTAGPGSGFVALAGGDGDDTLRGSGSGNNLEGDAGDDTLRAGDGGIIGDRLIGGTGADTLVGGRGNDSLNGSDGDDLLEGGGGDDTLIGEAGDDTLRGGDGKDFLNGWAGDDLLDGGPGPDELWGGDFISSPPGIDTADYSARAESVTVTIGDSVDDGADGEGDRVQGDMDNVIGGSGDDSLIGNAAPNVLDGGPGDDLLGGGLGADVLIGGDGSSDVVDYSGHTNPLAVDLDGAPGDDGEAGEGDTVAASVEGVRGGSGNDVLTGNASDNLLDGGPGSDTLMGLGGVDTVDYSGRTNPLTVDLDGAVGDDGESGEGDTVAADVEGVWGGSGNDVLTGNAADNFLDGGLGSDTLKGLGGIDTVDYSGRTNALTVVLDGLPNDGEAGEADNVGEDIEDVFGGSGDDTLIGDAQANTLDGGGGDDDLDGGLGTDMLIGGPGVDDTADYSTRTNSVFVGIDGTARSGESGENDTIARDVEDAVGGAGDDTLVGDGDSNTFDGGLGADVFIDIGGGDFDMVDYSSRTTAVSVSLDNIANDGAAGEHDNVEATIEDAFGGSGDDHFVGTIVGNLFIGGAGADTLDGAGGDDFLIGGPGSDSLTGGDGLDFFDGGADDDSIQSRDDLGEDVLCGTGTDAVVADVDDSTEDCEAVHLGAPLVTTDAATEITESTARLGGTVNAAGQATSAHVELGTTIVYGTSGTTLSVPADVDTYEVTSRWSGLAAGTTYHYRLVATNADGTTNGSDRTFTTAGAAISVPGAPTFVVAVAPPGSQALVVWTAPGSDGGGAITNYVVTPYVGDVAQAATTVANVTSATINGLSYGTSYTFKVAARNTAGIGPQSAASNAVTPKAPPVSVAPKCVVPNLIGKPLDTAKTKIKKAHCRVGKVSYKLSTKAKRNRVLSETPKPGKRVANGTKVNVVVGRGGKR